MGSLGLDIRPIMYIGPKVIMFWNYEYLYQRLFFYLFV